MNKKMKKFYGIGLLFAGMSLSPHQIFGMESGQAGILQRIQTNMNLFSQVFSELSYREALNLSEVSKGCLQSFTQICSLAERELTEKEEFLNESESMEFLADEEAVDRVEFFELGSVFDFHREYKIQHELEDLIEHNRKNHYKEWSDISNCTPQRKFLVNDLFIELMALSLNIAASVNLETARHDDFDLERYKKICNRLEQLYIYENCHLRKAVQYLSSSENSLFSGFAKAPDLSFYLDKNGYDNEKSLHLYFKYLHGKNPDIQGLVKDKLYSQVEGAMGDFIRSQADLHPIRVKKKINFDEIKKVILQDPGITHRSMGKTFKFLMEEYWFGYRKEEKEKEEHFQFVLKSPEYLKKLSKFFIKYEYTFAEDFNFKFIDSRHNNDAYYLPSLDGLYAYRTNSSDYGKCLHFLSHSTAFLMLKLGKMIEWHKEALSRNRNERAQYHKKQLNILTTINSKSEEERDALFVSYKYDEYLRIKSYWQKSVDAYVLLGSVFYGKFTEVAGKLWERNGHLK